MWGPTASCPACGKHLEPHCPSPTCPWGRCGDCRKLWNRQGQGVPRGDTQDGR